jgi:hypothetical protein
MVAEGAIRERRPREYAPYVAATSGDDRGETRLATHRGRISCKKEDFRAKDGDGAQWELSRCYPNSSDQPTTPAICRPKRLHLPLGHRWSPAR